MSRLFLVLAMIIGLAFFGCGEQADEAGNGVDGDNGNAGTSEGSGNAWATVDYAMSTVAASDTVYIKGKMK